MVLVPPTYAPALTNNFEILGDSEEVRQIGGQEARLPGVDVEEEGLHHTHPRLAQDHNRVRTREILQQISAEKRKDHCCWLI